MKIISVVGARPNFIKVAPFIRAIESHNASYTDISNPDTSNPDRHVEHLLVHTGQHYDARMSAVFFESLNIPQADIHLGVGSGSHAEQVGRTMMAFETVIRDEQPDWVVLFGDVNATLACSVTAKKEHVKVCHVEAGLRSGDIHMPEEVNRLVTDRLSDLLLVPDRMAAENLRLEGIPEEAIAFVGNVMIDTLEANREKAEKLKLVGILRNNFRGEKDKVPDELSSFSLLSMHRPSNVDQRKILEPIVDYLVNEFCINETLVWPVHPRTGKQLERFGLWDRLARHERIFLLQPVNYHEMLKLNMDARMMLTDSGGLQEECCVLGTPCLTLRWNTERPITLRENGGGSILVGNSVERIREACAILAAEKRKPRRPELWDGHAAGRCLDRILCF